MKNKRKIVDLKDDFDWTTKETKVNNISLENNYS